VNAAGFAVHCVALLVKSNCVFIPGQLSNDFTARRQLSAVVARIADVLLHNVWVLCCVCIVIDLSVLSQEVGWEERFLFCVG